MTQRIFSTLTLWLIAICIPFYFGPDGGVWILTCLSFLTQFELYSLLEKIGFRPQKLLGCTVGAGLILGIWYLPKITGLSSSELSLDILMASTVAISLTLLIRPNFTETQTSIMPTLMGLLLVPFMLQAYVHVFHYYQKIGSSFEGLLMVLWLIAVAKFTDVGGLILGKCFGRHKLAKDISPGKTWEGAFAGILTACLVGAGLCMAFEHYQLLTLPLNTDRAILFAIPIAIISIASDLIESVLKRKAGVKDSGAMIPGIGGAFDLTDSLLLSAPVGYLLFKYWLF